MQRCLLSLLTLLLFVSVSSAEDKAPEFAITIKADKTDRENVPVVVPLVLMRDAPTVTSVAVVLGDGRTLPGQLTAPSLRTEGRLTALGVRRDLHFVLDKLPADKDVTATCRIVAVPTASSFRWTQPKEGPSGTILQRGETPVLGYVHAAYDPSTPDTRNRTYKVFHHLWSPDGKRLVTNGGHTDGLPKETKLQFPHHRGIFFGFNKVSYDGGKKKADTWHCQKDDHISHEAVVGTEQGPVLGRQRVRLNWHGPGKEVFAQEEREITAYHLKGGTLIEWSTLLKTTGGPVTLDGDPQHAGFQFRAANEVAVKHEKETYYLRPDGKGKPNETRNWPQNKDHVNLPWNAVCFKLGDQRYTVAYLDHASNPREARHSERAYGRFGYYFQYQLTMEKPLRLTYRLWLQDGEMTGDQVKTLHRDFNEPPKVDVKVK